MDPEIKKLLQESIDISRENNVLMRKMVRAQKISNIYRVVYWGIIIFSSIGAYYYIQPFLGQIFNAYGFSGGSNVTDITKNLNKQQIEDFLNAMKK